MCVFGEKRGLPGEEGLCCWKAGDRITQAPPILRVSRSRDNGDDGFKSEQRPGLTSGMACVRAERP